VRVKQRATLSFWSLEEKLSALIQKKVQTLPPDHDIGSLYTSVENEANNQKLSLPTGLMDIRIHDIRRTFGSYQAISGASLQIIGKSLGHKSQQSTQIYSRLHNDPVRASIDTATEAMLNLSNEETNKSE